MGTDHSCCVIRDASIFTTENSTRHCLLLSHQHVGHIHSKMSTAGFSSFFGSFSQRQRYFDTPIRWHATKCLSFLSLYPMIFEYWARICRRYQSVRPILADTDILNPRILMHEARKADNPHGCTVFSGFFEPFLYPKTGVSYIWPGEGGGGGVRISLPNAPIWPQWTALENVMKCDERHMFGLSFTAFIYCIMSIRTFSLILHVLFLTI